MMTMMAYIILGALILFLLVAILVLTLPEDEHEICDFTDNFKQNAFIFGDSGDDDPDARLR